MLKISIETKKPTKNFVKIVITSDAQNVHRFVECADGTLEYRMGSGKNVEMTPRKFITFCRSIIAASKTHHIEKFSVSFEDLCFPSVVEKFNTALIASTIAENFRLAAYTFTKYKSNDKKQSERKTLTEIVVTNIHEKRTKEAFERGLTVATYVNHARDIANTSAQDMTPSKLADEARKLSKGTEVKVRVLGEKELKKLKMNLLLAVGQGTQQETKFIVLEYFGAQNKKEKPLVFIGKGITYDTGGLNLKPTGQMHDMHMDMSGGSSVIASVICAAKLGIKKNIIGLVPSAENAVSDRAMRAGDIVTAMNGKTVEILHTDAEGRLILADALTYSLRYNPKAILDVATLTGAALSALGQHASAIMTKDEKLETALRTLGEESGDYVWPLPLWDEYGQHIKSHRADISNIATNFSRYGGTIEGAIFLSHFAPACPWAHIDIAPRMESIVSDKLAKGSTGEPVRLLVKFAELY